MLPTGRRQRPHDAVRSALPKARLGDELADIRKQGVYRLIRHHPTGVLSAGGQKQFKILTVAQRVFQGRVAVAKGESIGVVVDRHKVYFNDHAHTAFRRQSRKVQRQPVADVHAGMKLVAFVQQQRLADPWLEVEMAAKNAAAEGPRDDDPVARPPSCGVG